MLIDSSPQPVTTATDADRNFVEMPFVARLRLSSTELQGEGGSELRAPAPYGLVADLNAALGHEVFHVAEAQVEAKVQPHSVSDDLSWKAMSAVERGRGGQHPPILRLPRGYRDNTRAVARKYPQKSPGEILHDLVQTTPGDEGKWFAAAKEEGLYDEALELASASPCDPRTLTRAARDLAVREPDFAIGDGLLALHWLANGFGYDVTGADVWAAYSSTIAAAQRKGNVAEVCARMRQIVSAEAPGGLVARVIGSELNK